jgi:outer membrane receptor protein involved in Fe transport
MSVIKSTTILMRRLLLAMSGAFLVLMALSPVSMAQTGKVSGTVTDAETGDPLPGVNIVLEAESVGATTDADGNYAILNVPPGTYSLRASFVGYADQVVEGVNVNIDLTTTQNFQLQEETQELEQVTVQANQPVVKPDISANTVNIESQDFENMPVTSVADVVSQQAGFDGLNVRGSDLEELDIQVDGLSMRGGRTNEATAAISYTSVEEIQVQTGGFNAEYGNVRSGLINVVTREGPRDRYTADILTRYTPAHQKWQGPRPDDPEGYYMKSYLPSANETYRGAEVPDDQNPAWVGTDNGPWDRYTQRQYPEFVGWEATAENFRDADNGIDNFTAEDALNVFKWAHHLDTRPEDARKPLTSKEAGVPDYTVDASFGGPVPAISDPLGDLRFFGSLRQTQTAYPIPQHRRAYRDQLVSLKLTSNLGPGMKLMVQGLHNQRLGVTDDNRVSTNMLTGTDMLYNLGWVAIFGDSWWSPMEVERQRVGGKFTHSLGANTFYTARLQRLQTDYRATAPRRRRLEPITSFGDMTVNEEPLGWMPDGDKTMWNTNNGGHQGNARDSSQVERWSGQFDITSQVNNYAQLKAGFDYIYNNYQMSYGSADSFFVGNTNPYYRWNRTPHQGAAYAQTKLEFEGMIANVGLRFDYFSPGGEWYDYSPYDAAFSPRFGYDQFGEVTGRRTAEASYKLSPRLGVSFPVTANSKLYFNYGHFAQMLDPRELFELREINTGAVDRIGNPEHPMPATVSYELGYEHNLFNQFLFRVTGYYKALGNQPRGVNYVDVTGQVDYYVARPWNYEDIRGAEFSLRKNSGWVRGFVNYTYMVTKSGNFGLGAFFENDFQQRNYEAAVYYNQISSPYPEPYARMNLEFLAPREWGPSVGGLHPIANWRVSFLGEWRMSAPFTYEGEGNISRLENNVKWTDQWALDMRINRAFNLGPTDLQFFVDVQNVLGLKRLSRWTSFQGSTDWNDYMQSLHLPEGTFQPEELEQEVDPPYVFVPGNDQPGDYRDEGVEFQPIEAVGMLDDVSTPGERPLYWEQASGEYYEYNGSEFVAADDQKVQEVLDSKAYIDMPNLRFLRFLNPRQAQFGFRVTF